jgi:hypothetical protein
MYVKKVLLVVLVFAVSLSFYNCSTDDGTNPLPGKQLVRGANDQYIIVYNDKNNDAPQSYDANAKAIAILESHGISSEALIDTYTFVIDGFSAKLTITEADLLAKDNRVEYVEPDQIFTLPEYKKLNNSKTENDGIQEDEIPCGITDIGGPKTNTTFSHLAWILDTGIDLNNSDLNVSPASPDGLSKTFVKIGDDATTPDDLENHGTHVSRTIAAKDNGVGVVGVAPGATVVAVKVLNKDGW